MENHRMGLRERFPPGVNELLNDVPDDKDDNRILECSHAAGSDYLVTGDNHLLKLRAHRRIRIIRPAELLAFLSPVTT
jgi:uncharacterized protein